MLIVEQNLQIYPSICGILVNFEFDCFKFDKGHAIYSVIDWRHGIVLPLDKAAFKQSVNHN
jgi:hypothetical protein